jgi:hypothetical protein
MFVIQKQARLSVIRRAILLSKENPKLLLLKEQGPNHLRTQNTKQTIVSILKETLS